MTRDDIEAGLERLNRQFMTPRIWCDDVWEVSANHGETHYVPVSVEPDATKLSDYIEGRIDTDDDGQVIASVVTNAWCAQLSASGYMDQTDLTIHQSQEEAEEYLVETYDDGYPLED